MFLKIVLVFFRNMTILFFLILSSISSFVGFKYKRWLCLMDCHYLERACLVVKWQILVYSSTHAFEGCADTVRGLAVMPGLGVLSASHDGLVTFSPSFIIPLLQIKTTTMHLLAWSYMSTKVEVFPLYFVCFPTWLFFPFLLLLLLLFLFSFSLLYISFSYLSCFYLLNV